ncbi:Choline kinase [Ekhidna lutea]|uniref:Choline kinase n=1 Tax=Ekhidna lutea TaxID=447679 RepID=A0A239FSA8_EKHLU|nr:phosphocholine cytidylyltransferase family protein [Ekhidna lutea]SNS59750.1 Choline kinase [Ekhidna lutea]
MTQTIETAVILAAGRGTRLQPYTFDIPKGFMQVGEEKLIERSVRILKENGIKNIIIGTGHLHEHYEKFAKENGLTTFLSPDYATTGSFHTLIYGSSLIKGDFLLLESDLLYHSDAIKTLVTSNKKDVILCSDFTQSNDEVYVEVVDGKLKNLSKKKEELGSIDAELVGIWRISFELLDKLKAHHKSASDATTKDYEIAIAQLTEENKVSVEKLDLAWCEIDNQEHLERAKQKILPLLD